MQHACACLSANIEDGGRLLASCQMVAMAVRHPPSHGESSQFNGRDVKHCSLEKGNACIVTTTAHTTEPQYGIARRVSIHHFREADGTKQFADPWWLPGSADDDNTRRSPSTKVA